MGRINWGRVLLGGIVAGIIINACEYVVNGVLLARDWAAAMQALGHPIPTNATGGFIFWGFMVGITSVASYAVARPRFGPGPKTAIVSAMGYWVIGYLLPNVSLALMAIFPVRLLNIGVLVGFVEIIVGTLAGAWLYKES